MKSIMQNVCVETLGTVAENIALAPWIELELQSDLPASFVTLATGFPLCSKSCSDVTICGRPLPIIRTHWTCIRPTTLRLRFDVNEYTSVLHQNNHRHSSSWSKNRTSESLQWTTVQNVQVIGDRSVWKWRWLLVDSTVNLRLHGAETFLRSRQLCSYSRTSRHFMEPRGSLPCSKEPATGPYPVPDQSSAYHLILSKTHFNIIHASMSWSS
jgi:hypothetical protein